jgi:hypothetical protein
VKWSSFVAVAVLMPLTDLIKGAIVALNSVFNPFISSTASDAFDSAFMAAFFASIEYWRVCSAASLAAND